MGGQVDMGITPQRSAEVAHATSLVDVRERSEGARRPAVVVDGPIAADWRMIRDVHWPGRRFDISDYIVVTPGGVFVVDSTNLSGLSRAAAATSAVEKAAWLRHLLDVDATVVRPVLCLAGGATVSGPRRDLLVCSPVTLEATLRKQRPVLTPAQAAGMHSVLTQALVAAPTKGEPRVVAGQMPGHAAPRSNVRYVSSMVHETYVRATIAAACLFTIWSIAERVFAVQR